MKKPLPPIWFLLAVAAMTALHYLQPVVRWLQGPWRWIGAVPIAAGIALAVAGNVRFHLAGTTIKPFEVSSTLVTGWPFSMSRNPMYLGMVLVLTGIWMAQGTLTPVAVIPVFAAWITAGFIQIEERMMEETFGDSYREFRRRVRRWI